MDPLKVLFPFLKTIFYQKVTTTTAFPPFLLLAFSGRGAILLLSNVDSIIAVYLSSKLKKSHARLKKNKNVFPHIVSVETILFLILKSKDQSQANQFTLHKCAEIIQGSKLFKGGNYMRKYGNRSRVARVEWMLAHAAHCTLGWANKDLRLFYPSTVKSITVDCLG